MQDENENENVVASILDNLTSYFDGEKKNSISITENEKARVNSIVEDLEINEEQKKKEKFSRKDSNIIPFTLNKVIGIEFPTGFLNLTLNSRHTYVIYSVGHCIILHNYRTKEQRFLLGHKNEIGNLSCDSSCHWLATSGKRQGLVIVWNIEDFCPMNTITDAHGMYSVEKLALSQDAKYLITVGNEPKPLIKIWLWTLGKDEPCGTYEARSFAGSCKNICYNMNATNQFMVTFETFVVFLTWENDQLIGKISKTRGKKNIGKYTSSTYLLRSSTCVTTTDCGWVIVWGNEIYITPYREENNNNDKCFLKAIKLQNKTITIVTSVNRLYVTGDVDGFIKFYDRKLRILFWITHFDLKPIVEIAFHRYRKKQCYEDIDEKFYKTPKKATSLMETAKVFGLIGDYENHVEYYEKIIEDLIPIDATLTKKPFIIRDFLVLTSDSQLGYINILQNKYEVLIKKTTTNITSMAVHPKCSVLCLGFEDGRITSYNYDNNDYLVDRYIPKIRDEQSNAVTCIRYSYEAAHLTCGTSAGTFWFLHPVIIEPKMQKPFKFDNEAILNIKFSQYNEYCAYYDENMGVCIFMFDIDEPVQFKYIYRVIAHYRPIVNMEFIYYEEVNRLITIGEDRYLVEYDISKCEEGTVGIKSSTLIEQTAIPTNFIYQRELNSNGCLIVSENKFKYKLMSDNDFVVQQTILGPTIDEPIQQMLTIPPFENQKKCILFATQRYLGIQLLPADGNPYKHVALKCHPTEILEFAITCDYNYVFLISKDNNCCFMWKIKLNSVLNMVERGGSELEPYYGLIEGGVSGWLFKEMQDLFYYMQILNQGENSPESRIVSDKIELTELPNLMRAIGYYPTEYELNNLLREAESFHFDEMKKVHEITFQEFVKLYINHRPAFGISVENIRKCFSILSDSGNPIARETFITKMCSRGEPFSETSLRQCFSLLINYNDNEDKSKDIDKILPENITFSSFMKDILGTDVDLPEIEEIHKIYEQKSSFRHFTM